MRIASLLSVASSNNGLTHSYYILDAAYRIPIEEVKGLPTISVHPIGYDDAAEFLKYALLNLLLRPHLLF